MEERKPRHPNSLLIYRRRLGFTQKHVARLLGHRDTSMVSRYETGRSLPPLEVALKLEIIYRVPVAFLFPQAYEQLREALRRKETRLSRRPLSPTNPPGSQDH